MAPRPSWKGYLRLSLVNIPVRLYTATATSSTVSFNQLHDKCGTRINMKRWCPECDQEVPWEHIVKGYEFAKGRFVTMEDADFDNVRLETSDAIRLQQFIEEDQLPALFVQGAHYMAPDGKVAAEAYAVMRTAMKGKVGIGQLVQNGRERIVAVQPWENALVLYTLYYKDEVKDVADIPGVPDAPDEIAERELQLARQLIESVTTDFDLSAYKDEYRSALMQVIEQKIEGQEVTPTYTAETPQVIDLMQALKASLDRAGKEKKKPARAELQQASGDGKAARGERASRRAAAAEQPPRKRARGR